MAPELLLALIAILLVAVAASAMELRASLQPPVCPRCVHCRHEALARKTHDGREGRFAARSLWGSDDPDDDGSRRP